MSTGFDSRIHMIFPAKKWMIYSEMESIDVMRSHTVRYQRECREGWWLLPSPYTEHFTSSPTVKGVSNEAARAFNASLSSVTNKQADILVGRWIYKQSRYLTCLLLNQWLLYTANLCIHSKYQPSKQRIPCDGRHDKPTLDEKQT